MYIHIYMYTIFGISFVPAREGRCTHGSRERERNRKVRVWWILTYTHIRARCGYFRQKMNINREAAACVMRDFPSDLQINAPVVRLISKGESRDATRTKAFVGRPYVAATFDHPSSATLVVGYARRTRVYIYIFFFFLSFIFFKAHYTVNGRAALSECYAFFFWLLYAPECACVFK